eukprot:NODE_10835_length_1325_cov_6.253756.p1 GENE.NODE_10835_length_1325_cov_6.253756~~NODE_10835_length_1325_cov_6.253756.p1  ORF type:complete len:327 (+),score=64.58 NODE_10835_length_1325_cov_6.253756:148-1128(+)
MTRSMTLNEPVQLMHVQGLSEDGSGVIETGACSRLKTCFSHIIPRREPARRPEQLSLPNQPAALLYASGSGVPSFQEADGMGSFRRVQSPSGSFHPMRLSSESASSFRTAVSTPVVTRAAHAVEPAPAAPPVAVASPKPLATQHTASFGTDATSEVGATAAAAASSSREAASDDAGRLEVQVVACTDLKDAEYRFGSMMVKVLEVAKKSKLRPQVEVTLGSKNWRSDFKQADKDGDCRIGETTSFPLSAEQAHCIGVPLQLEFTVRDRQNKRSALYSDNPRIGTGTLEVTEELVIEGGPFTVEVSRHDKPRGNVHVMLTRQMPPWS